MAYFYIYQNPNDFLNKQCASKNSIYNPAEQLHTKHIRTDMITRIVFEISFDDSCLLQNPFNNVHVNLLTSQISESSNLLDNGALVVDKQGGEVSTALTA